METKQSLWRCMAMDASNLRRSMTCLMCNHDYQELLTKKEIAALNKSLYYLDKFRSEAEERMFKTGGLQDIKIWYSGGR